MAFLSRRTSAASSSESGGGTHRGLMKRVSTIWTPSKKSTAGIEGKKTKGIEGKRTRERRISESDEDSDSVDDIRRPSGLGRAVSISDSDDFRSIENNSVSHQLSVPSTPPSSHGYRGSKSTPSLVKKLSKRLGKDKPVPVLPVPVHSPPQSTSSLFLPQFPNPPAYVPPSRFSLSTSSPYPSHPLTPITPRPWGPQIPLLPEEVLVEILFFLPRTLVASTICTLSRAFCAASKKVLYGSLDLTDVSPTRYDSLFSFLVSRRDLTDLVETFILREWPPSLTVDDHGRILTGSTTRLTIILQNMPSLQKLVLPAFDLALLRHHSAFGLKHLEFLNAGGLSINGVEGRAFFSWLDGQTNITSLRLTNLLDSNEETEPVELPPLRPTSFLMPSPTFTDFPVDASSATLLPSLTTLHAPPSLLTLLSPNRPLVDVSINISSTLYSGLRPGSIFGTLKDKADMRRLKVCFSKVVDRRTEDKVLVAATSTLSALAELAICIVDLAGNDEGMYKILSSVLPRLKGLRVLDLSYHPLPPQRPPPLQLSLEQPSPPPSPDPSVVTALSGSSSTWGADGHSRYYMIGSGGYDNRGVLAVEPKFYENGWSRSTSPSVFNGALPSPSQSLFTRPSPPVALSNGLEDTSRLSAKSSSPRGPIRSVPPSPAARSFTAPPRGLGADYGREGSFLSAPATSRSSPRPRAESSPSLIIGDDVSAEFVLSRSPYPDVPYTPYASTAALHDPPPGITLNAHSASSSRTSLGAPPTPVKDRPPSAYKIPLPPSPLLLDEMLESKPRKRASMASINTSASEMLFPPLKKGPLVLSLPGTPRAIPSPMPQRTASLSISTAGPSVPVIPLEGLGERTRTLSLPTTPAYLSPSLASVMSRGSMGTNPYLTPTPPPRVMMTNWGSGIDGQRAVFSPRKNRKSAVSSLGGVDEEGSEWSCGGGSSNHKSVKSVDMSTLASVSTIVTEDDEGEVEIKEAVVVDVSPPPTARPRPVVKPVLPEADRARLVLLRRHCPTLERVRFFGGGVWTLGDGDEDV